MYFYRRNSLNITRYHFYRPNNLKGTKILNSSRILALIKENNCYTEIFKKEVKMPINRLKEYLDDHNVEYITINHSRAFTAQTIAAKAHIPGKKLAKSVIIMMDGKMVMAVLPASYRVDFPQLKIALGANKVELAHEYEFKTKFPDCELGAMPPFGNLYGVDVYVAKSLAEDEEIAFNACTHSLLIKMRYEDFDRLVKPKILTFSVK